MSSNEAEKWCNHAANAFPPYPYSWETGVAWIVRELMYEGLQQSRSMGSKSACSNGGTSVFMSIRDLDLRAPSAVVSMQAEK